MESLTYELRKSEEGVHLRYIRNFLYFLDSSLLPLQIYWGKKGIKKTNSTSVRGGHGENVNCWLTQELDLGNHRLLTSLLSLEHMFCPPFPH